MKEGEGRVRDPGARRQNIVSAALQLFAQKGVAATSIRDISSLAGESISTVYYYFDDKDDLFRSVMIEATISNMAPVMEAENDTGGSSLDRLRRILEAYLDFIIQHREPAMMLVRGLLRVLEYEDTPFMHVMADRFKVIEDILEEGRRKGELADIDTTLFAYSFLGQAVTLFFANLVAETVEDWPYRAYSREELLAFAERTLLAALEVEPEGG
ncbi:MAG: TetR/AcrR family transcriptional regulator [Actinobacteria bacterium]|nr:TetR/AcrR family transcriptional regulator [Actinomycetota bacterium]MBU1944712.1 TetR/AcrR family transcriptional regulator [Actinomycetota bacterium]MBU2688030.1 TetR/AcrR family transcriptional regulator [Actinomycetota bacterium]